MKMQSPGRRESGWRVGQGTPTSGRHSGPQGRGRFIAVRLDGPQARSPQRCDGVCHSNLRMTPNAGIPAEKGPPRNWGPSRRPPSAGCADRRSAFPCGRHHLALSAFRVCASHARRGVQEDPIMGVSPGGGSSLTRLVSRAPPRSRCPRGFHYRLLGCYPRRVPIHRRTVD